MAAAMCKYHPPPPSHTSKATAQQRNQKQKVGANRRESCSRDARAVSLKAGHYVDRGNGKTDLAQLSAKLEWEPVKKGKGQKKHGPDQRNKTYKFHSQYERCEL
eukprot:RCo049923